ncbi:MAG: hypothetical protein R2706_13745 [Acidimicrobiales bacterium]
MRGGSSTPFMTVQGRLAASSGIEFDALVCNYELSQWVTGLGVAAIVVAINPSIAKHRTSGHRVVVRSASSSLTYQFFQKPFPIEQLALALRPEEANADGRQALAIGANSTSSVPPSRSMSPEPPQARCRCRQAAGRRSPVRPAQANNPRRSSAESGRAVATVARTVTRSACVSLCTNYSPWRRQVGLDQEHKRKTPESTPHRRLERQAGLLMVR